MLVVYAFAAWTVFVWGTRVRNIIEDQGSAFDLLTALLLTALGLAVAVAARLGRLAPILAVAAAATLVTWAVRAPLIVFDLEHGLAFKVVHALLALVSAGLALAAWRTTNFWPVARDRRRPISQAEPTS